MLLLAASAPCLFFFYYAAVDIATSDARYAATMRLIFALMRLRHAERHANMPLFTTLRYYGGE